MNSALDEVLAVRGGESPEPGEVTLTGADPVLPTRFRIGDTCAAVLGGIGVAVNDLWEMKTGRRQQASVDVRRAAAGLKSSDQLRKPDANGVFAPIVNSGHM